MTRTETAFDALNKLVSDLKIGMVSGQLQPPTAGRLFLGDQSLADILLPAFSGRFAAVGIVPGGPGYKHVSLDTATLDAEAVAHMIDAVENAGGHVYQGRLAHFTPEEWLQTHGSKTAMPRENDILTAARAVGWPAAFEDEPILFLGEEPLYYLLMRENVGRAVTILVGALEER